MLSSFLLATMAAACCGTAPADRWARVDDQGVLRWQDDRSEVALFGVNYYAPFSADYEGLARLGEDHRVVIDQVGCEARPFTGRQPSPLYAEG